MKILKTNSLMRKAIQLSALSQKTNATIVIDATISHLKTLISFFEIYRETGFEYDKIIAK